MPIKKSEIRQLITKKKIGHKSEKKYLFHTVIGIIVVILIFYFILHDKDKDTQKGFLNRGFIKNHAVEERKIKTNPMPYVDKARLELISSDNRDIIKVIIEKKEPDIDYRFQWKINGKVIENYEGDSISGFKEDDTIGVTVTPFRKNEVGQPRFFSLTVHSTVPKVLGISEPKTDNNIMVFKVLTEGKDEIIYSLMEAPSGMRIDNKTGEITWNVKDVPSGRYEGKVLIKNKKGAEVLYPFSINLG